MFLTILYIYLIIAGAVGAYFCPTINSWKDFFKLLWLMIIWPITVVAFLCWAKWGTH